MEFGRPVGDRLARLRGTRRLRDHQLAGDAARGPARPSGEARCTRPADRHGRRLLRWRHSTGRRRHRRPDRRDRADHRMAQPHHLAVQGPGVQEQLGHAAHGGPARHARPDRTRGSIPRRSSATSPAWCRRPTRTCWRTGAPATSSSKITAPTLLIQGTVDTLFTLQEADENAMALIGNHVPTKVVWFCGGHGACVSTTNDGTMVVGATLNWLDRWVKERRERGDRPAIRMGRPARDQVLLGDLSGATGRSGRRVDR